MRSLPLVFQFSASSFVSRLRPRVNGVAAVRLRDSARRRIYAVSEPPRVYPAEDRAKGHRSHSGRKCWADFLSQRRGICRWLQAAEFKPRGEAADTADMWVLRSESISLGENRLVGLRPSVNAPYSEAGSFDGGPIRGALATLAYSDGSLGLCLPVRGLKSGQLWFHTRDQRLEDPVELHDALYEALIFGEALGFLFDDDLVEGVRGMEKAQEHWRSLTANNPLPGSAAGSEKQGTHPKALKGRGGCGAARSAGFGPIVCPTADWRGARGAGLTKFRRPVLAQASGRFEDLNRSAPVGAKSISPARPPGSDEAGFLAKILGRL